MVSTCPEQAKRKSDYLIPNVGQKDRLMHKFIIMNNLGSDESSI